MRPSRRAAAVSLFTLGGVLGAIALGWFPQGLLRRQVEATLRELVGPQSRIGSLRMVPGRLSAEIRGLVLDSPTYRLEADFVRVVLSRRTLLEAGLFVDRLEMNGGHLLLRTPSEPMRPAGPPSSPLVIRTIAIRGVTLSYEDPDLGGVVALRPVDVHGGIGEGVLTASARGGTWRSAEPLTLGPLHARLRISPWLDLHLESLEAGLERTRLRAAGALGRVGDLRPEIWFETEVDLDEIALLANIAPASGTVSGEGRLWGPVDALRVKAEFMGESLQASGWPLERLRARLAHERTGTADTTVTAQVGVFGGQGRLEARLRGTAVRGTLTASGLDLDRLAARLAGGSPGSGTAALTVRLQGDTGRGVEVEAEAEAAGRDHNRTRFRARARARGPVRLPEPELDLTWTAELETDPAAGASVPPGRLSVQGRARGALPPAVDADVDGTLALRGVAGPEPVTVSGRVRSEGDRVSADLRITGLGGTAEATAESAGPRLRALELRGSGLELGRLVPDARGQASFELRARGPFDALSGTGELRIASLFWRDVSLGALQAGLTTTRGEVQVLAELPRLELTAEARLRPGDRAAVRGALTLAGTPIGTFAPLLPEGRPLEGTLTGRLRFDLPLANPAAGSAEGRIEVLEARSDAFAVRAVEPFGVRLADGRFAIEGLDLRGPGFAVRVDGTAGIEADSALDMHAAVQAALAELPVSQTWTAAGAARAELALAGTRSLPRLDGFVSLEDVALESPEVPPVRVEGGRLELQGDAVVVPGLVAHVAGGQVRVDGRVPLAAVWREARRVAERTALDEEAQLAIAWSGVQAGALLRPLAAAGGTAIEGTLAGRIELRGRFTSLGELSGTLAIPATTARVQEVTVEIAPAEVRLEAGRITAPGLELCAAGGALDVSGTVDLESRELDLTGHGTLDLRALSPFVEEAALSGTSVVDLRVSGTLDAPRPEGTVRVSDATLRLRMLPQAVTGVSADVILDGRTLRLESASAALGGGKILASGQATLEGTALRDARFALTGRDIALRYPEGMRSRLEADLALTGRSGDFHLGGTVRALRGLYDLDTALEESFSPPPRESAGSPLLRSVALDIRVVTENPVLVRNNLAQLQATGRLNVRGDLQTPAPVGTLEIASGGKVFLQGREFVIGSGRLAYEGTWDPELALEATARIPDFDRQTGLKRADVDVTVALAGRLNAPGVSLRSDPAYSRLEIVNLIATGDSQNVSARLAVGGPAATLLAGRLTRTVGSLGLDQVSIQPELVAREGEVETGARFTFGKRLSERVNLVYSLSLQDPEGRFIQVQATPGRDVTLSVRRTDDGSFTYGAGQRFHFGGTRVRSEASEQRVRVVEVRLEGDRPLEPEELRSAIRVSPGERKTVWDLQEDADRLRERLIERGYLEAEVGTRFEGQVATFTVRSGSRYRWTVEGMVDSPDLTRAIRSSLFEEEALDRGRARLLEELRGRGHLRATVMARALPGEARTLAFEARPGPVLQAEVSFPGAAALSSSRLLAVAGGAGRLITDAGAAVRDIAAAYHEALYLGAEVDVPRVEPSPDGERVHVIVPVREGPRARLAAVRFEGATLPLADLTRVAALETAVEYEPEAAVAAVDRLRDHYYGLGHPAVRINPRVDARGDDVELVLEVAEGPRVSVGAVVLRGLRHARESLVRRHVPLAPGDPLDPRKVAELERRLLDLGLFARAAATVSDDNPATVTVTLEEGDRLRAGYLLSVNGDRNSRAELDGELRNLLGAGLSAGGRLSVGPDVRDARAALSVPSLLLPTGRLTASLFRLQEDLPLAVGDEDGATFGRVQTGGQIQGTLPFGHRWSLLYGYRLKSVSVTSEFLSSSHRVAGLDVSLLRDTRDNPLDARRGRFLSLSLELSPRALGSDFDFVKGFVQAFVTRPLTRTLTWAQGYRLGLAHALRGEPLVADEGFEAGGANSIRGFGTNEVGPADYPFGKQAVIVLNQELRYRHPTGLGAVLFYDAGNTFARASDLSLRLRHVLGAGLRWASPIGLLRVDLGAPLFPRAGESRYKLFFSFGQAF